MTKAWVWIKAHWPVVVAAVIGALGFVLGGIFVKELRRPDKRVRRELDAVREGELAARVAIDHGAEHATKMLEELHHDTIAKLEDAQRAKLEGLRRDPRRMARYLTNLSRRP